MLVRMGLCTMVITGLFSLFANADDSENKKQAMAADTPLAFTMDNIDGEPVELSKYKGDVVLIVNVASKCGFTPQYKDLQDVYTKYKDQGFVVLGFPANDFMGQEPGSNKEIKEFCSSKYHVTFPMFAKVTVKGDDAPPLYQYLTSKEKLDENGGAIPWNFTKFLVGRDGKVIARYGPRTKPSDAELSKAIEKALEAPKPDKKPA